MTDETEEPQVELCSEGRCGLPATKGGLCAGHNRLMEYHPFEATNE